MINNTRLYAPMTDALDRAIGRIPADAPERHRLELTREFLIFVTREMQCSPSAGSGTSAPCSVTGTEAPPCPSLP